MSSVSGNWSQIIKLCVNLNSAILRCNAVAPIADIGEPSAVFNFDCGGLYRCLVAIFNFLVGGISEVVIWQLLSLSELHSISLHELL